MRFEFPRFVPHPLIRGGHAQTIAGAYLPLGYARYAAKQHEVALADGDRGSARPTDRRPIVDPLGFAFIAISPQMLAETQISCKFRG